MKKFKNYSISKKLITGFLTVTVIMLLVGAVGLLGMARIDAMDTYMYQVKTAPMNDLILAIENLYQIKSDSRDMVIQTGDSQKLSELEQNYKTQKEEFLNHAAAYKKSIDPADSESHGIIDEGVKLFTDTYDPAVLKCLEAAKGGNQKTSSAALTESSDQIQTIYNNFNTLISNRMDGIRSTSENNDRTASFASFILIAFVIMGAAAAIYLGMRISRMISEPIGHVVEAADRISLGYTDVNLGHIDSEDETGKLAESFKRMLESIRSQTAAAENISRGDFTREVPVRSEGDVLGLALERIKNDLNQTLLTIRTAAQQVHTGAEQVSSGAQALASGATEQAATIEELNASVTGVARQAEQNAENVEKATVYVREAGDGVNEGNIHMQKLNDTMKEIGASSHKISSITKVIEDIAFQTNILALNAAVESARAGSAGKGFAVVADEVRNLATKSSEAARQTAELIEQSVNRITDGEKYASETAVILKVVSEKASLAVSAIHEISEASSSQVLAIGEINQGLTQVSSVVQTNAATAEESSASSEEMAAQAEMLNQAVGRFSLSDDEPVINRFENPAFVTSAKIDYSSDKY